MNAHELTLDGIVTDLIAHAKAAGVPLWMAREQLIRAYDRAAEADDKSNHIESTGEGA